MNRRRTLSNRCSLLSALTLGHRLRRVAMGKFAMEGKHFTTSHLVSVASPNPSSHTFPSTSSAGLISLVASRQ
jgi:hypothetical protein